MMKYNLLSDKEHALIKAVLFKTLKSAEVYFLDYRRELTICAFIRLHFDDEVSLIVSNGEYADNIILISEFEFSLHKDKYLAQDGVTIKVIAFAELEKMSGDTLINIEFIRKPDDDYYWKVDLILTNMTMHINALIDELNFAVIPLH